MMRKSKYLRPLFRLTESPKMYVVTIDVERNGASWLLPIAARGTKA